MMSCARGQTHKKARRLYGLARQGLRWESGRECFENADGEVDGLKELHCFFEV